MEALETLKNRGITRIYNREKIEKRMREIPQNIVCL